MLPIIWACLLIAGAAAANLPIVDLGYKRHRASSFKGTVNGSLLPVYQYSLCRTPAGLPAVRPARPPTQTQSRDRQWHRTGYICPQSQACWFNVQNSFVNAGTAGSVFNFTAAYNQVYGVDGCTNPPLAAERDPLESEDCLLLGVYVPEKVMSKRHSAPVWVYFQDGAYVSGSKSGQDPSGLIHTSREDGSPGMIYVGVDYRRLALELVQRHISQFGGDPSRVTVMSVSTGWGSTTMQLTAYGRAISPPFAQTIVQSPAWEPDTKIPATEESVGYFPGIVECQQRGRGPASAISGLD
ncbi:Carboxylesterase type B [Penicillium canescens]|uniref:Carboxylesterase type B n=1 Tax=Penicillium canescens TaxID=5083 RepID=A0AAD6I0A4_PENCN|nr:Carboxylesterase type B [Penicillium canescens]